MDKRSNRVQRVDVREEEWDRHPFLGEEEKEENREAKRAGCSPWRRVGIVGIAAGIAAGIEADTEASALMGIVASAGIAAGTALAKESSPPSPPQSTEASSEPA